MVGQGLPAKSPRAVTARQSLPAEGLGQLESCRESSVPGERGRGVGEGDVSQHVFQWNISLSVSLGAVVSAPLGESQCCLHIKCSKKSCRKQLV